MAFYGTVIDPFYTRGKQLGTGTYGSVTLTKERKTNMMYAMKTVGKENLKVLHNIRGLKCLIHPHLVCLYDFLETTYFHHIVMEYMDGGNLRQRIGNLTPSLSKFYFFQMCEAIKYLHSKGVVHRNLKPENILLACKNTKTLLVVSDFGLNLNFGIYCTWSKQPIYLAPEVINSKDKFSKSADIWSLGVILLECLNGKPAFPTPTLALEGELCFHDLSRENVLKNVKSLIKAVVVLDPKRRASINSILKCTWMNDLAMIRDVEEIRERYK